MRSPFRHTEPSHGQTPDTEAAVAPRQLRDCGSAGGDTPRTVIRGESSDLTPNPVTPGYAAITDWLNCTFPLPESREDINFFFREFLDVVGERFGPMTETGKGLHGWRRSFALGNTGAMFAIGGQRDKALLSIPGSACTNIPLDAWSTLVILLRDVLKATITRWDGAVDDYNGIHSVDWAVEQYQTGGFSTGGNKPSCDQKGNWIEPDGSGRTFYIGKRKNGKMLRVYEKGKQLGDPTSHWVRWELEVHRKDREIPWDVLLNPGPYVAGAYQCTAWINEKPSRIRTYTTASKIGYDKLTYHASQAYGRLLTVMLDQEGSAEKVLEKLLRPGIPARLDLPVPPELEGKAR